MQPDEFASQSSLKSSISTQDLNEPIRQQETQILNELKELQYFPFNSSNSLTLYSHTLWTSEQKLLVATKENNIKEFYFEQIENGELEPRTSVNRLSFNDNNSSQTTSWISSIDIFDLNSFSILTVAFVSGRKLNQSESYSIYIYCDFESRCLSSILNGLRPTKFENIESLAHNVTNIIYLDKNNLEKQETFILANCNKRRNLLFKIDTDKKTFIQIDNIDEYFCEYKYENIPQNITSNDLKYISNKTQRITAIGCQNGWLGLFLVDVLSNALLKQIDYENDSFITSVRLFSIKSNFSWLKQTKHDSNDIQLLVLRTLEPTRIFKNPFETHFQDYLDLEYSSSYDIPTSVCIFDLTFNQLNTIAISTFGKRVLFYTFNVYEQAYELRKELLQKHSIMAIRQCELTQNGAYDLAIITLNGVSIWQYNPDFIFNLINKRVK